jgi:MFS family permease
LDTVLLTANNLSTGTFRSLKNYNYRLWACGALVSNIGTWMQRTAQDWIVLTMLTNHNATAVGIVMALQFGPQILMLPWTGHAADHMDRRKLLITTQAVMGVLALGLGILTLTNLIQLWEVYVFAFLLGCAAAFDAPARQTFVAEMVGEEDLSNAVGLNSTSFNAGRMVGPAIAGVLIASVGSGWVFLINALTFAGVIAALYFLRVSELHVSEKAIRSANSFAEGFQYVWNRSDLRVILLMLFIMGTFGYNFTIYISTMSVTAFHAGSAQYGVVTSVMAVGSVIGALLSAKREKPHIRIIIYAALTFTIGLTIAAFMPHYLLFALVLLFVGISAQTFSTTTISLVQLSTEPQMRGRVMAILLAVALGGTPIGSPIVGWVVDHFGPRWGMSVGIVAGIIVTVVGLAYVARHAGDNDVTDSA